MKSNHRVMLVTIRDLVKTAVSLAAAANEDMVRRLDMEDQALIDVHERLLYVHDRLEEMIREDEEGDE